MPGPPTSPKAGIGFGNAVRAGEDEEAIKRMFTPEFRNRLDAIIPFAALTPEIVGRVVEKFVMQLEAQLADRNVTIELSSARQGIGWPNAATSRSMARARSAA